MSCVPTARCRFCGCLYLLEKIAAHEGICSARPKRPRGRSRMPVRVIIAHKNLVR